MQLVIAEKPSVARDLARVLGMRASGRHAIEGPARVITWCIGHLVELEEPPAYDPRWKSWRLDTLPMIPNAFKLRAVAGTRDQLGAVRDLLRDRRFSEVVNGCDAGREGELIFRYVYELAGSRLPVRRLWISSLTDEAIRKGFDNLRPGREYDALGDAARCRSEADWLVGMNATRAVTLRFRATGGPTIDPAPQPAADPGGETRAGGRGGAGRPTGAARAARPGGRSAARWGGGRTALPAVYSIGRVQTPTLAILVRREQAIVAFQPRDYWEVRGTFTPAEPGAEKFAALWTHGRHSDNATITRVGERALGDAIVARAGARASARDPAGPVIERLLQKRSREPPPMLFDLTSLQRTANRRYGLSATRTLEAAQALYERHKLLTYPRTDSRHLPADMVAELPKLFGGLAKIPAYAAFAAPLLAGDAARGGQTRRIFDGSKVHDHHAIIPTGKVPAAGALGQDEQHVFDLVVRRFLGAFHPDAEFALTEAVVRVGAAGAAAATATTSTPVDAPVATRPTGMPVSSGGNAPSETATSEQPLLSALPPPPDRFVARGRVRLVAGWQAVAGIDDRRGGAPAPRASARGDARAPGGRDDGEGVAESPTLPPLVEGQRLDGRFETVARQTRPPPRHTEATLLGAMESAGREIDDEVLRAAMKDTGLGTPATRAATIETLVKRQFIVREGKLVVPTATGIGLIERLPIPTLASPELTGAWEARLARIARGQDTRTAFMTDIALYVRQITDAIRQTPGITSRNGPTPASQPSKTSDSKAHKKADSKAHKKADKKADKTGGPRAQGEGAAVELPCPRCREGRLMTGNRGWGCSRWRDGCLFVIWFQTAGKQVTAAQLRALVQRGKTRPGTWTTADGGTAAGRLVLDLTASRETGAARFLPG